MLPVNCGSAYWCTSKCYKTRLRCEPTPISLEAGGATFAFEFMAIPSINSDKGAGASLIGEGTESNSSSPIHPCKHSKYQGNCCEYYSNLYYSHPVLSKSACFIGTYRCGSAHRFARGQSVYCNYPHRTSTEDEEYYLRTKQ